MPRTDDDTQPRIDYRGPMKENMLLLLAIVSSGGAAQAIDVTCCRPNGTCSTTTDLACEEELAAVVAPSPNSTASVPANCSHGKTLRNDARASLVAVDSCQAAIPAKPLGKARVCLVRDVLHDDGMTAIASTEVVELHWPMFSTRHERGRPRFRDPVPGDVFWIIIDERDWDRPLPTVFAAERKDGVRCAP